MPGKLLSKSKYLNGIQCPRLLWISVNDKRQLPPVDPVTQAVFDQGHEVGELAKQLYPGGYDILSEGFMENIALTRQALKQRVPLFEAGFWVNNLYARADILKPVGDNAWDLIEVKSSTSRKDINLHDVAFQKYVYQEAGIEIRHCYLGYINNQFVKQGPIDPKEFFIVEDISDYVSELLPGIGDRATEMLEMLTSEQCPENGIGPHCSDPYDCALRDQCWSFLPEDHIFTLYWGGNKAFELFEAGVDRVAEIPPSFKLNAKQLVQVAAVRSGEAHLNAGPISEFLRGLEYPVHYLDFETISPAVPLYDGMRPYQRLPFQYSLHVVAEPGAEPVHYSFLMRGTDDPRPELITGLKSQIGPSGSIVAYNMGFEQGVIRELGEAFPHHADWGEAVNARMVDLLVPFRNFDYYHPAQRGSASMKKVLPALTGRGYDALAINEGELASVMFQNVTFGNATDEARERVLRELEIYCGQDTEGMIWIVDRLAALVAGGHP